MGGVKGRGAEVEFLENWLCLGVFFGLVGIGWDGIGLVWDVYPSWIVATRIP